MNDKRFAGKTVFVSGAARGLGRRAAERFADEGARLVLCDVDARELGDVSRALSARGVELASLACDVADESAAAALVGLALDRFDRLDIAVNNAGIGQPFLKLPAIETAMMRRLFEVNLLGVFLAMKHQLPAMERQGGGVVLNVASVAGVVGSPLLSAYAAVKHGVVGLTKSAAGEYAKANIRINALCPAFTATEMVEDMLGAMRDGPAAAGARVVANVPLRRIASQDEIVQAMLFACSPDNSFMTGHALVLDGGLSAI